MQIQRLQNLYLLIALILQVSSIFIPWWTTADASKISVCTDPVLLILCCLAAALSLVGIFLFKNLRRQKLVAAIAALIGLLSVSYAFALTYIDTESAVTMALGGCPMAIGAIFDIMARNCMIRDDKLLRSADRLR